MPAWTTFVSGWSRDLYISKENHQKWSEVKKNLLFGTAKWPGKSQHAKQNGYSVVKICREEVSGNASEDQRRDLHRVEELARSGEIKKMLVHEVSRLARRNSVAHAFVEMLEELGVSLYWHTQGIETLLPNGMRNPRTFAELCELAN